MEVDLFGQSSSQFFLFYTLSDPCLTSLISSFLCFITMFSEFEYWVLGYFDMWLFYVYLDVKASSWAAYLCIICWWVLRFWWFFYLVDRTWFGFYFGSQIDCLCWFFGCLLSYELVVFGVIVERLLVSDVAGKLLLGDLCLIKPLKFSFKYFIACFS